MENNPSDYWYEGEIGFFAYYVIPMTKKLKECGVFGVSAAEYLRHAEQNFEQGEIRGKDVVADFVEKLAQ
jgi:hypothetical protein